MRINVNEYIVIDSEICHGKPTFKGTRIMVHLILEMLETGATITEIIEAYPSLKEKHIRAALEYAARLTEHSLDLIPTSHEASA
ncbi:MAG TPA: DUF433 domain-containing protein [Candidatus Nanoarchaeia archaeon]|nr:DUF433 domain-containing protein [Candidatus Nanoarchaeia archaeon]